MSDAKDGGPAFPQCYAPPLTKISAASLERADKNLKDAYRPGEFIQVTTPSDVEFRYVGQGMSLRDWFAGQALAGIIAFPIPGQEKIPENAARDAYLFSDAMLSARLPSPPKEEGR